MGLLLVQWKSANYIEDNAEQDEPTAINKCLENSNNILQLEIINYDFIGNHTGNLMCIYGTKVM